MNQKKNKTALITGMVGQDGSYLAELLLSKGYQVHGVLRWDSVFTTERIEHLYQDPHLIGARIFGHYGDLTDTGNLERLINQVKPDEVYHLGAMSVAGECFCPILSAQKMDYRTLEDLWREQIRRGKKIRVKNIDGVKVEVIDLSHNTQLKALGMWNGMGTWFPIRQISRHQWKGKIAKMSQKFGSIMVTPNHSILDINQKICKPEDNPWLLSVRKINYKPNKYINNIELKLDGRYEYDKDYFWLNERGESGKVLRVIKEDKLKPFCRFVGAYIAEGHITFNKTNKNWYVGISNSNKKWLEGLEADLKTFYEGGYWYIRHKKDNFEDVWELQIKSRALFNLFKKLLGKESKNKQLPYWFSQIKNEYLAEIWKKMLEGDGCVDKKCGFRYGTISYKLACQLGWMLTTLGYDYTVHQQKNKCSLSWHIRECKSYQPTQGEEERKIEWINYDGWVYDITVDKVHNFTVGVGNIVVHNSHVRVSFDMPESTANIDGLGTLRILEAIKNSGLPIKFYMAASSEMFGVSPPPQNENTPFHPRSPYACAKVFSYHITRFYREAYGIFAANGILFNHESFRRGPTFVTKKITRTIAKIKKGLDKKIYLGNLDAKRDWGLAQEYVQAMYLILQQPKPDDFVIATGQAHSVREFLEEAFRYAGFHIESNGKKGVEEKYINKETGEVIVDIDPHYFRPAEVEILLGNPAKAKEKLNWQSEIGFRELVRIMIDADFRALGLEPPGEGDKILKEKLPHRWWRVD